VRKIIYSMLVSLDGYIATPDGGLDWVTINDELHTFMNDRERDISANIYGRRMYETMAGFWPTADQIPDAPAYIVDYARLWREIPKVVFSTTLESVDWNSRLVRDDIAGEVARLKAEPGGDMSVSGAELAASFMELGLIDACWLIVQPVILGRGIPMFREHDGRIGMELVESRTFDCGVVFLNYQRTDSESR